MKSIRKYSRAQYEPFFFWNQQLMENQLGIVYDFDRKSIGTCKNIRQKCRQVFRNCPGILPKSSWKFSGTPWTATTLHCKMQNYPINMLIKNTLKNKVPHILTQMEDSRTGKLTIWVKCCVEFGFHVENAQQLHPYLETVEKRT